MTFPALEFPGTSFASLGYGKFAANLPLSADMYAGYLLGTDYWANSPYTPIRDITGNGRDLVPTFVAGAIGGAKVTAGGTGYTTAPTVGITGGGGTGAAATAVILNGAVIDLIWTNVGSGYTTAPTIGFTGGGGTGAAATAVISTWGQHSLLGPGNYADTPFTGDQLTAATGEATLITIAKVDPSQTSWPFGNRISGTSGVKWMGIQTPGSGTAATASQRLDANQQDSSETDTNTTRSGFEFYAATYRPGGTQLWRTKTGGGLRVRTEDTSPALASSGGTLALRFGRNRSTGDGIAEVAAGFAFTRRLTTTEIQTFLDAATPLFAQSGVTVQQ